jgi:hypothetical protein
MCRPEVACSCLKLLIVVIAIVSICSIVDTRGSVQMEAILFIFVGGQKMWTIFFLFGGIMFLFMFGLCGPEVD